MYKIIFLNKCCCCCYTNYCCARKKHFSDVLYREYALMYQDKLGFSISHCRQKKQRQIFFLDYLTKVCS